MQLCAAVRDNMDLERVFVLFHSNAQGDAVVKVLGHDRYVITLHYINGVISM